MKRWIHSATEVKTYRNKRNPNKYVEVHEDGYGHRSAKQYMHWDETDVTNPTGDGNLHRWKKGNMEDLLEDYEEVESCNVTASTSFDSWYNSLSSRDQAKVDDLADNMGLPLYEECSEAELAQLHDSFVSACTDVSASSNYERHLADQHTSDNNFGGPGYAEAQSDEEIYSRVESLGWNDAEQNIPQKTYSEFCKVCNEDRINCNERWFRVYRNAYESMLNQLLRSVDASDNVCASDWQDDPNADMYVVKIWYEVEPGYDAPNGPQAAEEIIETVATSPQEAIEYAKRQWSGPIDRIEVVDVNPDKTAEEIPFEASSMVTASTKNTSQCSFDFDLGHDYDEDYIDHKLTDIFADLGAEVIGTDYHSVDYTSVGDPNLYSQCTVDYVWHEPLDGDALEAAIAELINDQGGNLLGLDTYRIEMVDTNSEDDPEEIPLSSCTDVNASSYSGSKYEDWYNAESYPEIDPNRIAAIKNIHWDITPEDIEIFLTEDETFPDLTQIDYVSYFDNDQEKWAEANGYEGGYNVIFSDGAEKQYAWLPYPHNLDPLTDVTVDLSF